MKGNEPEEVFCDRKKSGIKNSDQVCGGDRREYQEICRLDGELELVKNYQPHEKGDDSQPRREQNFYSACECRFDLICLFACRIEGYCRKGRAAIGLFVLSVFSCIAGWHRF